MFQKRVHKTGCLSDLIIEYATECSVILWFRRSAVQTFKRSVEQTFRRSTVQTFRRINGLSIEQMIIQAVNRMNDNKILSIK